MKDFPVYRKLAVRGYAIGLALAVFGAVRILAQTDSYDTNAFSFIAAGDMRNFISGAPTGKCYFEGLCDAVKKVGAGDFMIGPGDCDPPAPVRAAIDRHIGTNYLWYPVIGNHDAALPGDMAWVRHWAETGIPHLVQRGPAGAEDTTYSFDAGNSHFVVMNYYYDGHSDATGNGDVPDTALDWLKKDLAATHQPLIWVVGHKPIKSIPDMDSGRSRHAEDSVSANPLHRKKFVDLLKQYQVRAYICGHTHNCSITKVEDIWQADSGHARGAGDIGSPSTFLKFRILGRQSWVDVYRSDTNGVDYRLRATLELK